MKKQLEQSSKTPEPARRKDRGKSIKDSMTTEQVSRRPLESRTADLLSPYWHLLPLWLATKYRGGRNPSRLEFRFLDRMVRAQYLLFRAIRMQDDLFDGHVQTPSLIFKSDQLLFEAEEIVSEFFPKNSRFWKVYWSSLQSTVESIVEVDMLQQKRSTPSVRLLDGYVKICTVFKISSAAVCARANRWHDFLSVSVFCDEMALAGQIVDDLRDIGEDLERNRYNYVVNVLSRTSGKKGPMAETSTLVAQRFLQGDRCARIFGEIGKHLAGAQRAAHALKLPEATLFLVRYAGEVENLERLFEVTRMEIAFGNLSKVD